MPRKPGQRDLVVQKPRRRTWSLQVKVPRDLVGHYIGKRGKPVGIVEVQLKATDHAAAVAEALPIRVEILNRFEELRYQRRVRDADDPGDRITINPKLAAEYLASMGEAPPTHGKVGTVMKIVPPSVLGLIDPYVNARRDLKPKTRTMIRASLALLATRFHTIESLEPFRVVAWADKMTAAEKDGGAGLAPATANAHLSKCSQWWEWAKRRGHVQGAINPFRGAWQKGEGKRDAFTAAQLNKLLRPSPLRWHILTALFTGARLSELVKARVADGAALVIEGEHLKTEAAERTIPLHSQLIAASFVDDWPAANTMPADTVSEKFTAWRRECGIGAPRGKRSALSFHSLRHNFAHELKRVGTPRLIHDALMGHSSGGLFARYAGTDAPEFQILKAAIEKLEFPGLNL